MRQRSNVRIGIFVSMAICACAGEQRDERIRTDPAIYESNAMFEADQMLDSGFGIWTQSVGLLVHKGLLTCSRDPDDPYCDLPVTTPNRSLADLGGLCDDRERLGNQPHPATDGVATAFLVHDGNAGNSSTMITAGHFFDAVGCEQTSVVFNYWLALADLAIDDGVDRVRIPKEALYDCVALHAQQVDIERDAQSGDIVYDDDYAVFSVRQTYSEKTYPRWGICLSDAPEEGETDVPVYSVGHPLGLPMKFSFGGRVIASSPDEQSLEIDLPGIPGMSGSPIMNGWTHQAIGIMSVTPRPVFEQKTDANGNRCAAVYRFHPSTGSPYFPHASLVGNARAALTELYPDRDLSCPYAY